MFKKVFYNTGAQIAGKIITASITLLISLIIFRTLGASGYGDFTKVFVFVGYFYTLADFGLNTIYIKITKENEISHLKPLLGLRILIGMTLAMVAVTIAQVLPYDQASETGFSPLVKIGIVIASATIITQAIFTTTNAFFQKILRYDLSTLAAAFGYLIILTTAVVVTFTTKSILGFSTAYVLGGVSLATLAYLIIARRVKNFFTPTFSRQKFLTFLRPAWPVGVALLFNLIYFRIDVLILSNFRTSSEVGLYGLAYQFFETSLAVPIFFSNAIYPILSNLYKENENVFKKQLFSWLKILTLASLLLTTALFVVSNFIPIFFGQSSQGTIPALRILALGIPFFFISALLWHVLIIYDRQKYLTVIYAVGALFNLIANLMFIPQYGYMAASVITVISEALIVLLLTLAIRKFLISKS